MHLRAFAAINFDNHGPYLPIKTLRIFSKNLARRQHRILSADRAYIRESFAVVESYYDIKEPIPFFICHVTSADHLSKAMSKGNTWLWSMTPVKENGQSSLQQNNRLSK